MKVRKVLPFIQLGLTAACSGTIPAETQTIYGSDQRVLIGNAPENVQQAGVAVALLTRKFNVIRSDTLRTIFKRFQLADVFQMCSDEPLKDSLMLGDCTGFAISETKLVTASHCIPDSKSCSDRLIVFGHTQPSENEFASENVYQCKQIESVLDRTAGDLVLITLDKPIKLPERTNFLSVQRKFDTNQDFQSAYVVGHPFGISLIAAPLESAPFAADPLGFFARTDVAQGSSGSPVLNPSTGEVIGVLTGGEHDLEWDAKNSCNRSHICLGDECTGERFTNSLTLTKLLENQP